MLYRKFPGVPEDLSVLGFGCMRLPVLANQQIDEPKATEMIRYAIDRGVNYIDTAYPYHDGQSEPFVGRALLDGYRERVRIATKLPAWLVTSRGDMDRYLDEQLARLRTDHIDFYLVHGLTQPSWDHLTSLEVTAFLDDAIADGRIRYAGFSFHDSSDLFREIVDAYDWTLAQIQYNYMDENTQAGTAGLRYAAERGLGIVVMEPIRGGMLAQEYPGITDAWNRAPVRRTPAEWALRWVWDHKEVNVALSGMSTLEQVQENLAYAEAGQPGSLTKRERDLIAEVRAKFEERIPIPCTGCRYCMPCPSAVNIPSCFEQYNQAHMFSSKEIAERLYVFANGGLFTGIPGFASCCRECGECGTKCPQGLPIPELLRDVAEYFGK
jgi:uncharacterized protein